MGVGHSLLVVAHVLSALAGFGALLATGGYAARAAGGAGPVDRAVRGYFRPGRNWLARALWLVPAFGAALVATSGGRFAIGQAWVAGGTAAWAVAAAVATGVVWPGERRLQGLVSAGHTHDHVAALARRVAWGSAVANLSGAVALALMLAKPGGPS